MFSTRVQPSHLHQAPANQSINQLTINEWTINQGSLLGSPLSPSAGSCQAINQSVNNQSVNHQSGFSFRVLLSHLHQAPARQSINQPKKSTELKNHHQSGFSSRVHSSYTFGWILSINHQSNYQHINDQPIDDTINESTNPNKPNSCPLIPGVKVQPDQPTNQPFGQRSNLLYGSTTTNSSRLLPGNQSINKPSKRILF